jgi:hypothetical protein
MYRKKKPRREGHSRRVRLKKAGRERNNKGNIFSRTKEIPFPV